MSEWVMVKIVSLNESDHRSLEGGIVIPLEVCYEQREEGLETISAILLSLIAVACTLNAEA